jgi:hypothetical protein
VLKAQKEAKMDKKQILKWVGVGFTVIGAVALFLSGTGEAVVVAIVGAVFVLAALVIGVFKV